MLHPLALHVPWLKRDKLVFVSLLCRGDNSMREQVLRRKLLGVRKPYRAAEARGKGKANGCNFGLPSASSHHVTTSPLRVCLLFLAWKKKKRMGWRTSHRSLSAFTTLYSELGSRGIHAYIHSTWKGFFSVILHKKDLTQVPFLIMWTCKMMSRLNSCEGQYVCSATSRICPLCFMLMQIVYDSFSLANMLKCHIASLVLHQEHENYCSFKKVWKWFPFFFSC